jgi:hypothetical protein
VDSSQRTLGLVFLPSKHLLFPKLWVCLCQFPNLGRQTEEEGIPLSRWGGYNDAV